MQNGADTLEENFGREFLTKLNRSSNCAACYLARGAANAGPHKNLHADVIAALLIIPETRKQPNCPAAAEWIKNGTSRKWNII